LLSCGNDSSLDLVLIEEECILSILKVVNYCFLSLVEWVWVLLGMREELLKHEEQLIPLLLLSYNLTNTTC
jgi:hypothetical protein